ncbi:uncharacterized protein YdhG (YjbR/CyaY superfamily) [Saonia flava]|uniref:Uncharacterized protein YdhG (YjbR/CyaY superfamily) n=1 Tax=Saonia flava TaxID=523696 RepID=A0A846R341_9FLAO|nr:DUF1801 domain-containing protein [Saonia flava]NJB71784.1 uncharacterized protein YdhG (YjbR/CyaY superfamily) [Saonia flava]
MTIDATTPDDYISKIPEERKPVLSKLRKIIKANLPKGFQECINYKMIGYVVPHEIYPDGYHCDPKLPLPFINLASQKNFVAVYHSGIYADKNLMEWFVEEFPKHCKRKLDMGKSCIRFKSMNDIPYGLIGELCTKMTTQDWIDLYEQNIKKNEK